ncbi:ShlB/FhaC/HecB family hemolysin secretion/activation protein [Burkholderia sp. WAC0059]|uniref:ShlB/FhaC/HecB family hemolysin secretion/activation protein n=1 Tax=Burkholderia sp. WAC0059 TaxID=2066022 RepID=UPI0015E07DA1|nr:ShlB/FhaC/HecB family hemolysin secretion/activation protein [Burkholderia sp. WAC0059]
MTYALRPASRRLAAATSFLTTLFASAAHAAGPALPGAGTILQQVQPPLAPSPAGTNAPGLEVAPPAPPGALPESPAFRVERIEIAGNTRIDTATLHALVAGAEGQDLMLADLGELGQRIADYYHAHGYPLARAVIPPQTVRDGIVRIDVIEARYGQVVLSNRSRVLDGLLSATLDGLRGGTVVAQAPLDHNLLLLSDIPGTTIHATLKPGATTGTSDLMVDVAPTPFVIGSVAADDDGERYTGRARVSATVNLIDPLHLGDVFSASAMTSGRDMNYGRLAYEALLDGIGTRAGASWSALDYRLGNAFSALDAHGTAQVASLWLKQPLIRSRALDVNAQLQYDHLQLNDDIDASATQTHRHLDTMTASVSGDLRDGWLGGGVNAWNASWMYGHVGFDGATDEEADAALAGTQGTFSKGDVSATRLQALGPRDALYLALTGQWASTNLDASQQLLVGGADTVRAYDANAIGGDSGYLFTAEYRHTFALPWYGQWQAIAFFDGAHVKVDETRYAAGENIANLAGVGVGLNWAGPDRIAVSASLATPLGGRPELAGSTSSVRLWAQVSKGF